MSHREGCIMRNSSIERQQERRASVRTWMEHGEGGRLTGRHAVLPAIDATTGAHVVHFATAAVQSASHCDRGAVAEHDPGSVLQGSRTLVSDEDRVIEGEAVCIVDLQRALQDGLEPTVIGATSDQQSRSCSFSFVGPRILRSATSEHEGTTRDREEYVSGPAQSIHDCLTAASSRFQAMLMTVQYAVESPTVPVRVPLACVPQKHGPPLSPPTAVMFLTFATRHV